MLNIAMIDDEKVSLGIAKASFEATFSSFGEATTIDCFDDPYAFLDAIKTKQYQLICSDIMMPKMSGIELVRKIREIDSEVPLVFISSNETNVFSCFEFNPIGFIRKNVFISDIENTVRHYVKDVLPNLKEAKKIEIKSHGKTCLVNVDDIMYIEGNHNYQNLYLASSKEPLEIRERINYMEDKLKEYGFLRIHKGFLINCKHVKAINASSMLMKNDKALPISRNNHDEIMERYMDITRESFIQPIN